MVKRDGFRSHWLSAYRFESCPLHNIGEKNVRNIKRQFKILIASLKKKSNFWKKVSELLSVPARKRITVNLGKLNDYKDGDIVVIPGKLVARTTG